MKGSIIKKLKKHWITVWLTAALICLTTILSFAAYTRISTVKRVISTEASEAMLFSSNYMQQAIKTTNEVASPEAYNEEGVHPTYIMNVCNFAQGNRGTWFYKTIEYTLTAQLVDKAKNASAVSGKVYTIRKKGSSQAAIDLSDGTSHTIGSFTLEYSRLHEAYDEFEIVLDKSELEKTSPEHYILVRATPTEDFGSAIPSVISGYIGVSQANTQESGWTGVIEDQRLDSNTYHGYNFVLHGTGKGTVTFIWDPRYLEISPISKTNNSLPDDTEITVSGVAYRQIKLSVDSEAKARYEINFFKKNGEDYGENVNTYLQFTGFEEEQEP